MAANAARYRMLAEGMNLGIGGLAGEATEPGSWFYALVASR